MDKLRDRFDDIQQSLEETAYQRDMLKKELEDLKGKYSQVRSLLIANFLI